MATMQEIVCKCGCGRKKMVRTADVKRGWGKFYSKSCKASYQEAKTGQYKKYLKTRRLFALEDEVDRQTIERSMHPQDPYSLGQE